MASDLPGFKNAAFTPGLNVVLAHRTKLAKAHDSRNAVGKTSFVTVLDFLLGSDAGPQHLLRRPELVRATFSLELEAGRTEYSVTRSGSTPGILEVNSHTLRLQAWREQLGKILFGLHGDPAQPSARSLLAFYLRNVASGAFLNPTETHRKQSSLEVQPAICHLLGLDVGIVAKVKEVAETERSVKELRKAAKDPILGTMLGQAGELDAQIQTLRIDAERASSVLKDFRVVDRYTEQRAEAERLSREIRRRNDELVMLERRLADIDHAMASERDAHPDFEYVRDVYFEISVVLPDAVRRRFEDVEEFHRSVVENRRQYLEAERGRVTGQIEQLRASVARSDDARAGIMRLLDAGGALETYNELQRQLGELSGRLVELSDRRATLDRWEDANRHLQLRSAELELQVSSDLYDRRSYIEDIKSMYAGFAFQLYGNRRPASLIIEPSRTGYKFHPTIGGDRSEGVRSMAIFCFDLTMAVTALRDGRGPDFLVHDSHLYDGVETRQVARALQVASETCMREGMQYVVTMNSDDFAKAVDEYPGLEYHQCAEMTDQYEDGGLFGIRFN